MRTNLVRIGNSRGLRLPKAILQACGIRDEVELTVAEGKLIVEPPREVRRGWAEAARAMGQRGDDELLDPAESTDFDRDEWEW